MALLAVLALFGSAWLLVRQRARLRLDESSLTGGVLAFLEVVIVIQLLGAASLLRPAATWAATLACVALNLLLAFWRRPLIPVRRGVPVPSLLWPAVIAVLFTMSVRLFLAWVLPPDGWDSLGYHLPIVLRWVGQGNFDLSGFLGAQRYFAWNGDLVSAWLALLSGNLALAKAAQALCLPLLAAAGFVIGRRLAGLKWAWACATAFISLPIVLIQSGMAYVDVFQTATWLAALASALSLARSGRSIHLWAFAAAFGLCLGSKSTLYFLAPLLLPLAVALYRAPRRPRPWLGQAALAAGLVLAAGIGSYVRNALLTGNPIFPFGLSVGGLRVFKGVLSAAEMPSNIEHWFVARRWGWLLYPFWEHVRDVPGYSHVNGFGPLFAVAWAAFPWVAFVASKRRDASAIVFLSLLPLVALFFLLVQPVQLPRYIIFAAPIPIVGLAYALRYSSDRLKRIGLKVWSIAIILGCLGVFAYLFRSPGVRAAGLRLVSGRPVDPWEYYAKQYPSVGPAWAALDSRLRAGDRVVVNYNELILPWSGLPPRADVRVVVLGQSVYPQVPYGRTEEEWLREAMGLRPAFLVVWSPAWNPGREAALSGALALRPELLERVGRWDSPQFGWVELWRVTGPQKLPSGR